MKQGYNDRMDDSLGNRDGKKSSKEQDYKDRRDEAKAMNKAEGKRAYQSVESMDKNSFDKTWAKFKADTKKAFGGKYAKGGSINNYDWKSKPLTLRTSDWQKKINYPRYHNFNGKTYNLIYNFDSRAEALRKIKDIGMTDTILQPIKYSDGKGGGLPKYFVYVSTDSADQYANGGGVDAEQLKGYYEKVQDEILDLLYDDGNMDYNEAEELAYEYKDEHTDLIRHEFEKGSSIKTAAERVLSRYNWGEDDGDDWDGDYAKGGEISVGAEGTLKNRGKVYVRAFDINKGIDDIERGKYTFTVFDEGRIDFMNQKEFEKNFTQTKKGFYAKGGSMESGGEIESWVGEKESKGYPVYVRKSGYPTQTISFHKSKELAEKKADKLGGKTYAEGGKTDDWIQGVEAEMKKKGTVGAFTKQAKRAGMTVKEFTKEVLDNPDKYSKRTRERAQFAKNVSKYESGGLFDSEGRKYSKKKGAFLTSEWFTGDLDFLNY